jgi:Rhodopirellula transposase DDE domain
VERLEKTLARVAREQALDQERLRRWVSFLALCGVLEQAVESGVIDTYYLKGGVAMELRFAGAARTTGLQVAAYLDRRFYPCGLKPTPDQIASLRLQRHETLPQWNYTIKPQL